MRYNSQWIEIDNENKSFEIDHEVYHFSERNGIIRIIGDDTSTWYCEVKSLKEFFEIDDISNHNWLPLDKDKENDLKNRLWNEIKEANQINKAAIERIICKNITDEQYNSLCVQFNVYLIKIQKECIR